jgi:hypothetical protein
MKAERYNMAYECKDSMYEAKHRRAEGDMEMEP